MRHDAHSPPVHPTSQDEANGREHVVCASDEEEKNRHHFAVYVHNCKLAMLLRREPVNQKTHEQVRLYPSQWRFSVDDVCDNQWHHYALTFRPPPTSVVQGLADETDDWTVETQVKLLIDGDPIPVDGDLIQITEDVPMHLIRQHSTQTRMTVGACWHSRVARYVQHFTVSLSPPSEVAF
ncbi:Calsyntenin-1 [Fasciola hepatica]|uniref:Calsyntenin-1 n=1 Tax=Fasciola hepatica TaxID=6192 RepID=A0A4E0QZ51_FASHE|nr:Calsyntenin-1 [Fasciola hepatica]